MKNLSTLSTMFAAVLFSLLSVNLFSQELEVTPGTLLFKTNPGSSQTQQIFVRNKAKTEQSFVFNLGDWLTDEKGEVKYLAPGTTARSCADWITVSPSLVTLQPNESVKVNVTMLVPNDNLSTKWAVLFVQSAIEKTGAAAIDKEVQMGLKVSARIAVPIYQSPDVNQLFKATINGLTETINDDGTRTYKTRVVNTGDKILDCKVYFTVSNLDNAHETNSNPIEFSLLPESDKTVEFTTDKAPDKGRYSVAAVLDYGHNEELEGVQLEVEVK